MKDARTCPVGMKKSNSKCVVDWSKIRAFDNIETSPVGVADRYTIILPGEEKAMYAMSQDANMPNGVCSYIGSDKFTYVHPDAKGKRINPRTLPKGTKKQIEFLLKEVV